MSITGYSRVFLGFYWVFIGFYWVWAGFTGFCSVLLGYLIGYG